MRRCAKAAVCVLLLLALCGCNYAAKAEGTWQGDGSLIFEMEGVEDPAPFDGAEQWVFDGDETAVATVNGRKVECRYSMTDDTLTLNAGGETSWGLRYELKGNTLCIGNAEYTRVN